MLWLNEVLAVPALGVHIKTEFKTKPKLIDCLAEFSHDLSNAGNSLIIEQKELWGFQIIFKNSGFKYTLTPNNIVGSFSYLISEEEQPGGFPHIQTPSLKTYIELVEELEKHFFSLLQVMENLVGIEYDRIGMVTYVKLDKDSLPPGLVAWIGYLSKPWGTELIKSNTKLLTKLHEGSDFHDRCHHDLRLDEETIETAGVELRLDFQRIFTDGIAFKKNELIAKIGLCKETALAYFEKFGEGDLNYD